MQHRGISTHDMTNIHRASLKFTVSLCSCLFYIRHGHTKLCSSILDHTNVFLGSGRNFRIYQIIWIILHDQISNAGKGCIVCTGTWATANADCHLST